MLFTSEGGIPKTDIEVRLHRLEVRYRAALSGAVVAKAHYLALVGEPSAMPAAIERAKLQWLKVDAHKRALAARMGELEDAAVWYS